MQLMDVEKGFAESLEHLLKRFCPEALMSILHENLLQMRTIEQELIVKAKGSRESELRGTRHVIETGHLENIITECASILSKRDLLDLLNELGSLCVIYGEHSAAKNILAKTITLAGNERPYAALIGTALCKRAEIRIRQAHWGGAETDLRKAATFFKKAKDHDGLAMVENSLGVHASEQGNTRQAAGHFKRAQTSFERSGNTERATTSQMNLGIVAMIEGRWDDALAGFQRALPRFEQLANVSRLSEVHHNMGMLFLAKGDLANAQSHFDECLRHANRSSYQAFVALAFLGKAAASARGEDFSVAMVYAQKALGMFRQLNDRLSIADAYRIKGIIHRELGQPQLAELYLRTSLRLNEEHNNPQNLGETYLELGKLYQRMHQKREATKAIRKAVASFRKIGAKHEVRNARAMLAA